MQWLDSPYVIALLVAGGVSAYLAFFVWARRSSPVATPLAMLLLGATVWQVGYAFELASDNESTKVLWAKVGYLGIVTVPTAWLAVALQYTGRGHWLSRRNLALLGMVPLATLMLSWTNEAHGLIWSSIKWDGSESFFVPEFVHGAWFWVFGAYSYLLIILGLILVGEAVLRTPRLYLAQGAALVVSALVPWATNWAFAVGLTPVPHLNLTAFAFVVSGVVLAWAMVQTRLLDITPVAREMIFENMRDGVIVVDPLNRVLECNSAARRIIGDAAESAIGRPIALVWPDAQDVLERLTDFTTEDLEIVVGRRPEQQTYTVAYSTIFDPRGDLAGRLITLQNTTDRKRAEVERERLLAEVMASRETLRSLSRRLAEVHEEERRHLAREIHDEFGQVLTGLTLTLEMTSHLPAEQAKASLNEAQRMVSGLMELVRQVSLDLRPAMLDDLGLLPALLWYFDRYTSQTHVAVSFHNEGIDGRFLPEVETAVYRIVQEGLTNVARHAGVKEAVVKLGHNRRVLRVHIEDVGVGFDPGVTLAKGAGSGLPGIRERVEFLGGQLKVESAPGKGTRLTCELPLHNGATS